MIQISKSCTNWAICSPEQRGKILKSNTNCLRDYWCRNDSMWPWKANGDSLHRTPCKKQVQQQEQQIPKNKSATWAHHQWKILQIFNWKIQKNGLKDVHIVWNNFIKIINFLNYHSSTHILPTNCFLRWEPNKKSSHKS